MRFAILLPVALLVPTSIRALEPADVWLIVNKNEPDSRRVADHYIARRGVPKGNVVELNLPSYRAEEARSKKGQLLDGIEP